MKRHRALLVVVAVAAMVGCQAEVQAPLELTNPEITMAALRKIDLRAGIYMPPAARHYTLEEGWAKFSVGQIIESNADEYLPKVFKEVSRLTAFPPPPEAAGNIDIAVVIDHVQGGFRTLGTFTHEMSASAEFGVYLPDGKAIRSLTPSSNVQVFMGSLDPSENIRKSYEGADIIGRDVVVKFLKDFPTAQAMAAYGDYRTSGAAADMRRTAARAQPSGTFPTQPIDLHFGAAESRPDDVAVIIGNADYGLQSRDIPNVVPAYADAAGMRKYAIEALGIREGNIIDLRDATGSQMVRVFGSETDPHGQLYDWIKPNRSRVFVYYAGHGAPADGEGNAYLVPADADAARIRLNGYPLARLYRNLSQLPATGVTVVLEACFSGASQAGSVIAKASPVFVRPKAPPVPKGLTVIAAGAPEQLASWDQDGKHSLFTTYFLKGMAGAADAKPYGNSDGAVALTELDAYLRDTLTYYARRYYGRDQTAAIVKGAHK